ncbi:hypothetical protein B0H16DRAFT_1749628 [Mycena metata]|uniref:Uncharacterized protein n=1 Tax=Mycena metata TaxID=1033252 RepID=A0AAD7DV25_9AGAR|nr:hypothetical protein B0H16DRAFT_1749628 [Mycena metata]
MSVHCCCAVSTLYIDGAGAAFHGSWAVADGECFGSAWMPQTRRSLRWNLPDGSPKSVVLVCVISPEDDLRLPWTTLESYAELSTIRLEDSLPAAHLSRLCRITVLCLGGLGLPNKEEKVVLPELVEFNYLFSWRVSESGKTAFHGLEFTSLQVLRIKSIYGSLMHLEDSVSLEIHAALTEFLERSPQLTVLQIALHVPYVAETLLGHLGVCGNLQDLDVTVCHKELFSPELFGGLSRLTVVPRLRFIRLPQLLAGRDHWDLDVDGDGRETGLEQMLRVRFGAGLERCDFARARRVGGGLGGCNDRRKDGQKLWAISAQWDELPTRWRMASQMQEHGIDWEWLSNSGNHSVTGGSGEKRFILIRQGGRVEETAEGPNGIGPRRLQAPAQWEGDSVPEWPGVRARMDSPCYGVGSGPHTPVFRPSEATAGSEAHAQRVRDWRAEGERHRDKFRADLEKKREALRLAELRAEHADSIFENTVSLVSVIPTTPEDIWLEIFKRALSGGAVSLYTLMGVCRDFRRMLTASDLAILWNPVELRDTYKEEGTSPDRSCEWRPGHQQVWNRAAASHVQLGYLDFARQREIGFKLSGIVPASVWAMMNKRAWSVFEISDFYSGEEAAAVVDLTLRVAPCPPIDTLVIKGALRHAEIRPFPEHEGDRFGTRMWGEGVRRGLQLMLPQGSPQAVVLVRTIEPNKDFKLPWSTLKCYAKAFTIRGARSWMSEIPSAHLRSLTGITILCLGGVRLPAMDKKDPWISLPLVQEFNYVFTWEFVRVGGTKAFQALKLEGLRVLRVKGTEGTDKGHGWGTPKQEDAAKQVHKALTKFLGRSLQLKILQIAFNIPFEGQTLLEELRRCQNLEELDVPICHPDLWTRELFGGLQDLEVCPKLRVMRLPQLGWGSDLWEDYEGDDRETETRRDVGLDEMLGARFGAGLRTFDLRPRGSMRDGYDEWGNERCSDAERWSDGPERWAEAVKWDWLGGAPLAGWVLPDDVWTRLLSLRAATGWDILLDERPPPLVW